MRQKFTTALLLILLTGFSLRAQNVKDLIISEVQVDSVELGNGYGQKAPWIEVFNTSYGTVKISGCYLTNDRKDLKKYFIPKTDSKAVVSPRQSVVFFADGDSGKGTFHTNFTIEAGQTVYMVSNDGRTIVDSLVIPASLAPGRSIAKFANDVKAMVFDDIHESDPTPATFQKNTVLDANGNAIEESKAEKLSRTDPHGYTMTIIAVSVVFLALIILYLCYSFIGYLCTRKFHFFKRRKKAAKGRKPDAETAAAIALALKMANGNETEAAIATALHHYLSESVHDQESYIITIRRK
ncbi:MAG: OadG family protein [Bacteroidales bacterium]|nr:OadG family protein [Bacteroidales bacterium]